jgi:hypothetical protein
MKSNPSSKVIIRHHQTIRQSHAYQTAEVSYGIEIPCDNNPEAMKIARKKAELFVEKALVRKMKQHQDVLNEIAKTNAGGK